MHTGTTGKCPTCSGFAKEYEEDRIVPVSKLLSVPLEKVRFFRCMNCGESYYSSEQRRLLRTRIDQKLGKEM